MSRILLVAPSPDDRLFFFLMLMGCPSFDPETIKTNVFIDFSAITKRSKLRAFAEAEHEKIIIEVQNYQKPLFSIVSTREEADVIIEMSRKIKYVEKKRETFLNIKWLEGPDFESLMKNGSNAANTKGIKVTALPENHSKAPTIHSCDQKHPEILNKNGFLEHCAWSIFFKVSIAA